MVRWCRDAMTRVFPVDSLKLSKGMCKASGSCPGRAGLLGEIWEPNVFGSGVTVTVSGSDCLLMNFIIIKRKQLQITARPHFPCFVLSRLQGNCTTAFPLRPNTTHNTATNPPQSSYKYMCISSDLSGMHSSFFILQV